MGPKYQAQTVRFVGKPPNLLSHLPSPIYGLLNISLSNKDT